MTRGPTEPAERFVRLAAAVRQQREQVARIVGEAEEARADFADREPPLRELRGIGAILHDFYTGIEHLFETIAPELNGGVPAGEAWQRELLTNMTLELPRIRPHVLASDTALALAEFLRFRHLFRNLYGFELQWPRLRDLLERLPDVCNSVEADLDRFESFLAATAGSGDPVGP